MGLSLPWAVAVHPYDAGDPRQDQWSSGKYTFADLSNIASYLCGRLGMLGVGESLPTPGNDWPFRPQATLYASEQGWCYGCHGCKEDCRGRNVCLAQELSEKCPNVIAVTHNYFQQVPGSSQGGQTYGLIAGDVAGDLSNGTTCPAFNAYVATSPSQWRRDASNYCCQQWQVGCPTPTDAEFVVM